jgi:hypothetical protein
MLVLPLFSLLPSKAAGRRKMYTGSHLYTGQPNAAILYSKLHFPSVSLEIYGWPNPLVRNLVMCALKNHSRTRAFNPQANYIDCSAAAAGKVVPNFTGRGVTRSVQRISSAVNLSFLFPGRYFFFQVTSHFSSRG